MSYVAKFFEFMVAHAMCDYALQSAWMAQMKRRAWGDEWFSVLSAHSLINGGGVYAVTGSVWLGMAETVCHAVIDYGKCEGWYGMWYDQSLHVLSKALWLVIYYLTERSLP